MPTYLFHIQRRQISYSGLTCFVWEQLKVLEKEKQREQRTEGIGDCGGQSEKANTVQKSYLTVTLNGSFVQYNTE